MKILLKMDGYIFRYTLNISLAKICWFLECTVTDFFCSNSFFLSPYNKTQASFLQAINFIIQYAVV